jgi:HK97 family phage major capsid protein
MPNDKAIVFGDFSHYYIINKRPFSIKTLVELFTKYNQVGYIGFEFIDGVLINRNAIKYLEIKT